MRGLGLKNYFKNPRFKKNSIIQPWVTNAHRKWTDLSRGWQVELRWASSASANGFRWTCRTRSTCSRRPRRPGSSEDLFRPPEWRLSSAGACAPPLERSWWSDKGPKQRHVHTACDNESVTAQLTSLYTGWSDVTELTLKMHDLKMTDKENYGSGKCKSGKWRTNF